MLIDHIEEVEALLSGYASQGAEGQSGERFKLQEYLARLEKQLERYNVATGEDLSPRAPMFVGLRARVDDDA